MQRFINVNLLTNDIKKKLVKLEELEELDAIDIIKRYIALIILMSKKYSSNHMLEKDDLVMQGIVGLLDAIQRFDPDRSENFHFLAITRIRSEMYDYFLSNRMPISIPRYVAVVLSHIDVMRSVVSPCIGSRSLIQDMVLEERLGEEWLEHLPLSLIHLVNRLKGKIAGIAKSQANCTYSQIVDKVQEEFSFVSLDDAYTSDYSSKITVNPEELYQNREVIRKLSDFASETHTNDKAFDIIKMFLGGHDNATIAAENSVSRGYVSFVTNAFIREVENDSPIYAEMQGAA